MFLTYHKLEFQVVTPRGDFLAANACQNTDLFFALRGGGGGTFGVVMEATMRARPAGTFQVYDVCAYPCYILRTDSFTQDCCEL